MKDLEVSSPACLMGRMHAFQKETCNATRSDRAAGAAAIRVAARLAVRSRLGLGLLSDRHPGPGAAGHSDHGPHEPAGHARDLTAGRREEGFRTGASANRY